MGTPKRQADADATAPIAATASANTVSATSGSTASTRSVTANAVNAERLLFGGLIRASRSQGDQDRVNTAIKVPPRGGVQALQRWLVVVPDLFEIGDPRGGATLVASIQFGQRVCDGGAELG